MPTSNSTPPASGSKAKGAAPPRAAWPTWAWSATPAPSGRGPTRSRRRCRRATSRGCTPWRSSRPLLRTPAGHVGMDRADRWIGLSDGGNGLEDRLRENFPRVEVIILDFFHPAEKLTGLARLLYPAGRGPRPRIKRGNGVSCSRRKGGAVLAAVLSGPETGTQLVLPTAGRRGILHWPCLESRDRAPGGLVYHVLNRVGREDAPLRQRGRLRGVRAGHGRSPQATPRGVQAGDGRSAPAAPIRILSYCVLSNHWHFVVWPEGGWPGHGFFPLAGAHPCDAVEGRASDRGVRSSRIRADSRASRCRATSICSRCCDVERKALGSPIPHSCGGLHRGGIGVQSLTFHVDSIGFYNPSLISFYGQMDDGSPVQLVQHVSQISFLLMAVERLDPTKPKRRFGFCGPSEATIEPRES